MPSIRDLDLKEKPEEVVVDGEVIDKDKRKIVRYSTTDHVSIPKSWVKNFRDAMHKPLLDLRLVKDQDGEVLIIITRVKEDAEKP